VSYLLSEIAQLSGVMSLFITGIVMKHYNWYPTFVVNEGVGGGV
jgi:hypothetical protein